MEKTIRSSSYRLFLKMLRKMRKAKGLSQEELAERIEQTQSFISKCERGERRINIVELRTFCKAMGISFTEFVKRLDKELKD